MKHHKQESHRSASETEQASKVPSSRVSDDPLRDRYRPLWITIFALALAYLATSANGQDAELPGPELTGPELTGPELIPSGAADGIGQVDSQNVSSDPAEATIESLPPPTTTLEHSDVPREIPVPVPNVLGTRLTAQATESSFGRPRYAVLQADLMNNDVDADPDGWKARVSVLDKNDFPTRYRANASFELIPRVPLSDFSGYVNADVKPVRWSSKLKFDPSGVATVPLPLRTRIDRAYGWDSQLHPAGFHHAGLRKTRQGVHAFGDRTFRRGTVITSGISRQAIRTQTGMPPIGQLTVKVSIPGEGVFSAVTIVPMRPPVLVDSSWPYR